MSDWLRRRTTVLFNCGTTRVRGNYSRLEVEAFGTHQVDRTDRLFCPQTSALSPNVHSLTFSILDNLTFYIALHCALACPLAVQTSPYFLFNSFASRKSDSNTSPRKHKYVSPGTAFHVVRPVHYYGEIRTSNGAFPKA